MSIFVGLWLLSGAIISTWNHDTFFRIDSFSRSNIWNWVEKKSANLLEMTKFYTISHQCAMPSQYMWRTSEKKKHTQERKMENRNSFDVVAKPHVDFFLFWTECGARLRLQHLINFNRISNIFNDLYLQAKKYWWEKKVETKKKKKIMCWKELTRFYWPAIACSDFSVLTRTKDKMIFYAISALLFTIVSLNLEFFEMVDWKNPLFRGFFHDFIFRHSGVRLYSTWILCTVITTETQKYIKRCVYEIRNVWYKNVCILNAFQPCASFDWHAETFHALLVCFVIWLCAHATHVVVSYRIVSNTVYAMLFLFKKIRV